MAPSILVKYTFDSLDDGFGAITVLTFLLISLVSDYDGVR